MIYYTILLLINIISRM